MAERIFLTAEEKKIALQKMYAIFNKECKKIEANKMLSNQKKSIRVDFDCSCGNKKIQDANVTLNFSLKAWVKILSLINSYNTEVQWHGLVVRDNDTTFTVYDILIFPHSVTSCTVTSQQEEYEKWLNSLTNDEYRDLRFHGHSHVNMGVTPSSVDTNYRINIIKNFGKPTPEDDYFYIFFIGNKKGSYDIEIYDISNNVLYNTKDILLNVELEEGETLQKFMCEAESVVSEITPKQSYKTSFINKYHANNFGGYDEFS